MIQPLPIQPLPQILEPGRDDDLFPAWCGVWAAAARCDRPDEESRPASDHVALGRSLVTPGGSRDGTHRAAIVDGDDSETSTPMVAVDEALDFRPAGHLSTWSLRL